MSICGTRCVSVVAAKKLLEYSRCNVEHHLLVSVTRLPSPLLRLSIRNDNLKAFKCRDIACKRSLKR